MTDNQQRNTDNSVFNLPKSMTLHVQQHSESKLMSNTCYRI